MTLDELIAAADPARGRHVAGGSVDDAQDLIKQLSADSRSASDEPLRHRRGAGADPRSPRRAGRRGDITIPVIGVTVAILVTGFALLGHQSHRARLRATAPESTKTHDPARTDRVVALGLDTTVDHALINELSVLREPQTAAARTFNTSPTGGARLAQHLPLVTALTRAIPLAHHETLYLFVTQRSQIKVPGRRAITRSGGLGMQFRARFQGFGECCATPESLRRPLGPQAEPYTLSQRPDWLYVELVPDDVAAVRWTFTTSVRSAAAGRSVRHHTVTVRVYHNIAAIALPNRGSPQSDAWYDTDRKLIVRATPRRHIN